MSLSVAVRWGLVRLPAVRSGFGPLFLLSRSGSDVLHVCQVSAGKLLRWQQQHPGWLTG